MDMIINGQAQGSVASVLLSNNFDVACLRPWVGNDGRTYLARKEANKLVAHAAPVGNGTLRQDEWKQIDTAVSVAAKERLRLVADLRAAGLTYNIPNGMGKTVLESERMGDITPATISMDPARQSEADRPEFDLINLPLPVIHKDFHFNLRQIASSRNNGSGIDVTTAELAARRVAEEAEKLAIGVAGSFTYGGATVYGLTNFPNAITTVDVTAPTESPWSPAIMVRQILAMRQKAMDKFHYGPYVLYVSPGWSQYLDDDYSTSKGDNTLRARIQAIEGITAIRQLDYLTGFKMILVQMTSDVIREVIGMEITTVQWETMGGMRVHFKVMAILVPQLRADYNGNTGIVYANTGY